MLELIKVQGGGDHMKKAGIIQVTDQFGLDSFYFAELHFDGKKLTIIDAKTRQQQTFPLSKIQTSLHACPNGLAFCTQQHTTITLLAQPLPLSDLFIALWQACLTVAH